LSTFDNMFRSIRLALILTLLLPFMARAQKDSSDAGMKFDLGIGKAKNLKLWPFLSVTNEPELKRLNILFSLYDMQHHKKPDYSKSHLFPIYWYSNQYGRNFRLLSFYYPSLFHYEYQKSDSSRTWSLLEIGPHAGLASITATPSGVYSQKNLLFLLWYQKDKIAQTSHFVFFPFIWDYKTPNEKTFLFLPFYGQDKQGLNRRYWITPFFWHRSNGINSHTTLFPILWHSRKGTGEFEERRTTLFPIFYSRKAEGIHNVTLFPFVFSLHNHKYHSFTLVPVFSIGHSTDSLSSHFSVGTLFWHFKSPGSITNDFFPIWWYGVSKEKDDKNRHNVFFPVWWSFDSWFPKKTIATDSAGVKNDSIVHTYSRVFFPLVFKSKGVNYQSFTLFPIFSEGHNKDYSRRHIGVTALFWHSVTPNRTFTTFIPVWWQGASHSEQKLADYRSSYHVLFPLWWEGSSWYHKFNQFSNPYDYQVTSKHKILFPIWWSLSSERTVKGQPTSTWYSTKVLFPFYWNLKSNDQSSLTILPLFSKGQTTDSLHKHWLITPFTGVVTSRDSRSFWIFPFYHRYTGKDRQEKDILLLVYHKETNPDFVSYGVLWPFFEYIRYHDGSEFHFFPFLWFQNTPKTKVSSILPFYLYRKDSAGQALHILWPLYTHKVVYDTLVAHYFLWRALSIEKYKNGDASTRFLYLVYAHVHKDGDTENSLFPFYYRSTDSDGSYYHSLLLSFYNYRKQKIENTPYYYQEQRIFWLIRLRSNYKSLKEKGVAKKRSELR